MTNNHWKPTEPRDGGGGGSQRSPLVPLLPRHLALLQFPCSNPLIYCDVQRYDRYQSRAPCPNTAIWNALVARVVRGSGICWCVAAWIHNTSSLCRYLTQKLRRSRQEVTDPSFSLLKSYWLTNEALQLGRTTALFICWPVFASPNEEW